MPKIKERDILKFLDGRSDPFELKSLQDWTQEDNTRIAELEGIQLVYDESEQINSYEHVDIDLEWLAFSGLIGGTVTDPVLEHSEIENLELLSFLDGIADTNTIEKIKSWENSHPENKKDLEIFRLIKAEAPGIRNLQLVDTINEFGDFQSKLNIKKEENAQPEKAVPIIQLSGPQKSEGFQWRYAVAASVTALVALAVWFFWPREYYTEYQTMASQETIFMEDGTKITLEPYTKIKYPKKLSKHKERRVFLEGKAEFDVATLENKPFTVETTKDVGVSVLGTIFRFEQNDVYQEVIETIEGTTKAFSLKNPSVNITMTAGNKYGYDGSKFVNLRPQVVDNSKEHNILEVLDFLMQESSWTVISTPYMAFDENGVVKIDLEKDVEEILEDLKQRADFDYIKLSCDRCFKVTKFRQSTM